MNARPISSSSARRSRENVKPDSACGRPEPLRHRQCHTSAYVLQAGLFMSAIWTAPSAVTGPLDRRRDLARISASILIAACPARFYGRRSSRQIEPYRSPHQVRASRSLSASINPAAERSPPIRRVCDCTGALVPVSVRRTRGPADGLSNAVRPRARSCRE